MVWIDLTWILFVWSVVGGFILGVAHCINYKGAIAMSDGWEFVNPVHVHKYNRVNWFGAIVVALIYNMLCPAGAMIYWLYKLCTFGRS